LSLHHHRLLAKNACTRQHRKALLKTLKQNRRKANPRRKKWTRNGTYHAHVRVVAQTRLADDGEIRALPSIGLHIAQHPVRHSSFFAPSALKIVKAAAAAAISELPVSSIELQLVISRHNLVALTNTRRRATNLVVKSYGTARNNKRNRA
jgi:hypothetical protein